MPAAICEDGRMLVITGVARAAVAGWAVAVLAGCTSDKPDPVPTGPPISATTVRGALLQPADIGPTWSAPAEPPDPALLVSFCGGNSTAPPTPSGATVVTSPAVDEGAKGAQSLTQIALVYPDAAAASAGLASLRTIADGCPPSVTVPAKSGGDRQEPAFTESVGASPLNEGEWTGFVLIRHKLYAAKQPATADTAVAVVAKRNVLLVDAYGVYRLGTASISPQFTTDWQKLVGTVLNRIDA
jgi:hypothetical protein